MKRCGLREQETNKFSFISHSLYVDMKLCADETDGDSKEPMCRFSMEVHGKNQVMEINLKIDEVIPEKSIAAACLAIDGWRNGQLEHEFDVCGWEQLACVLYSQEDRELYFVVYLDIQGDGLDNQLQIHVPLCEVDNLMDFLKKACGTV